MWLIYVGEIVEPRRQGLLTVKYADNSKIDQEEHEVRPWIDVLDFPEWKRIVTAVKGGLQYLRNRMDGRLPPQQVHYDCSAMFQVLKAVKVFDPSWAASNLDAESVDDLGVVTPIVDLIPSLHQELQAYHTAANSVKIDHTENKEDHSFTDQVLKFFKEYGEAFPSWCAAARIVFAFTPNSAAAERVFSLLSSMFGDQQENALGDYIQTAIMLSYNGRPIG